jgi:hypothetical protein
VSRIYQILGHGGAHWAPNEWFTLRLNISPTQPLLRPGQPIMLDTRPSCCQAFCGQVRNHDSCCNPILCQPLYNLRMAAFRALPLALVLTKLLAAQQAVSIPTEDGGRVCADLYGQGARAVVLAHGGRFNKESWREQGLALESEGFRVLAIDFRGFGCSTGPGQADFDSAPFENDVLAAVRYLKGHGAKTVSVVGGSAAVLLAMHRSSPRLVRSIESYFSVERRTSRQKS